MPDLHHLPANVQLQIYDLFLALHTYKHQRRLDTIYTRIKEGIDQAGEIDDSGIDEISVDDDEELSDSLPAVICTGYRLINLVWDNQMDFGHAKLSRCSMSLDDNEADVQVLRLYLSNDGWRWDALYDIHTFECLMPIYNYVNLDDQDMVQVMIDCLTGGNGAEIYFNKEADYGLEGEYEKYCQWLKEASENNYATTRFSDEFSNIRSLLRERFSSHLLKS